ncbi:hypothetical protein F444_09958 [Phytophthora nicotianae P1976]|uniref:Uncharacterized protein n=1 Tax=Phytophthora nicotianae P1976 TaxID=1317066 RepID=A0A081A5S7_PHYNI|nr:hypothetical protein F444_09958 [Phytophthora nicotianae P1976]
MSFNSFFSEAAECIAELIPVENVDLDFHNMFATGEDDDESTASVAMSPNASTAYNCSTVIYRHTAPSQLLTE